MSRRIQLILALAGLCPHFLAAGAFAIDANTLNLPALNFHDPLMSAGPDPGNLDPKEPVLRSDSTPAISDMEKAWESDHPEALADTKIADWSVYSSPDGRALSTRGQSRIDRVGLGVHRLFGQWVRVAGEVSAGDGSVGALVGGSCNINDRIQLYTNSGVDTKPIDSATPGLNGTLTSGARWRVSEKASVFGEERLNIATGQRGRAHAIGLDLRPAPHWTWGTVLEMGETSDPFAGIRQRRGGSLSVGYAWKEIRYGGSLALHMEDGDGSVRRKAWDARNDFEFQLAEAWSLLSHLNASLYSAHEDGPSEGAYIECITELTHKRSGTDSFNVLMKYAFSPNSPRDWQTDLEVGLFSPVNEITRVGIGYNFDQFSDKATDPSSEDRGWFLEIAGTF